jgi:hypothetical protein
MDFLLEKLLHYVARDPSLTFQVRLFRLMCMVTSMLCLFVISPANLVLPSIPLAVNIANIGLGCFALFCFCESKRGRNHLGLYLGVLVGSLNPVWFLNGGLNGSITWPEEIQPMKNRSFLRACTLALLLPATAWPDDQTSTNSFTRWAMQDYMLGDWDGQRSDLSRRGVDFEFFYIGSEPDNLAGGLNTGAIYQGLALAMLDLDSHKLLGYDGGKLHISGLWLHGQEGFSANYSGDYNRVNLLDFPNATRLGELWYAQQLSQNKLSMKVAAAHRAARRTKNGLCLPHT